LVFRSDGIERKAESENKGRMAAAAFTAWLLGGGGKKQLNTYLSDLGLVEKDVLTEKQKTILTERAKSIADKIMKMDKRGKTKNAKNI
jgi:hypothetical protein